MNYNEILNDLKQYYSNTLIVQYHGGPKATATIKLLVELLFQNVLLLQIRDAFDWRTAIGTQLDIIGQWVGVSRVYNSNPLVGNKLAYPQYSRITANSYIGNYDAQQGGYSDYTTFDDVTLPGGMLTYNDMVSVDNSLSDNEYRIVIGLKIIYNNIQSTIGEIDNAIWKYFGGQTYYSNEAVAINTVLYTDRDLTQKFGTVSTYTTSPNNIITVVDDEGTTVYAGYFNDEQQDNLYIVKLGEVYTTWNTSTMELTYHYPSATYAKVMQICLDKGVLPAPIGTKIQFGGY